MAHEHSFLLLAPPGVGKSETVYQAAQEAGKQAELVVEGASGELDRQVLERMLPPFEHMLRNAVVHGIEAAELRRERGKPEAGTITVRPSQDSAPLPVATTLPLISCPSASGRRTASAVRAEGRGERRLSLASPAPSATRRSARKAGVDLRRKAAGK